MRTSIAVVLLACAGLPLSAQLVVKLKPKTLAASESYAGAVEASLQARWSGQQHFLELDDKTADEEKCIEGKLVIRQRLSGGATHVPDGLLHDWVGAVYIPKTTISKVLDVLEDFDQHKAIYPEVVASKTLARTEHQVAGQWRLQQKGIVPVILDVEQDVRDGVVAPGKWTIHAYARKIVETDTTPFAGGKQFPADEGHGYLWRLYSYWSLEELAGGVLAECRTLSLSRDVPTGLGWAVGPYIRKMPEESLSSTLEHTREAVVRAR